MKPPKYVYNATIAVNVCQSVDRWQAATDTTTTVKGVNFQDAHDTALNKDNTEVSLRALVFIDSDYSTPHLDYWSLQKSSETAGRPMTITYGGDLYEVLTVDRVDNQHGKLDHWELSLK